MTGADAIHPGYGFLSESAYLAEASDACRITFIGPPVDVLRMLGDKSRAREAMRKAGLPVVPGTESLEDVTKARRAARRLGYPVILKATSGGGGRGMRVVRHADELDDAFPTARREAEASFGDPRVYLETYVEEARHIEFQVLADNHGATVHLGERECTLQRRHQKVLEETPSVELSDRVRERMGKLVTKAARAVGYVNAGTFEFLMDVRGRFYFMEANARLQGRASDHGDGDRGGHRQGADPDRERGPAVDATGRCALHGTRGRVPCERGASGDVRPQPRSDPHLQRCRVGPEFGSTPTRTPAARSRRTYDSLLAKVIAHGRDRPEAIDRMRRALEMTVIEGVETTISLHLRILADPDFLGGRFTTAFLERFVGPAPSSA